MRCGVLGLFCLCSLLRVGSGCSLDTRPKLLPGDGSPVPVESVKESMPEPAVTAGMGGSDAPGVAGGSPGDMGPLAGGPGDPSVTPPTPSDPMNDPNAGTAGSGPDMGGAGAAGEPTTGEPPMDPGSRSLSDLLRDLIAADPRVREAAAMRRILDALGDNSGTPPNVTEVLDALGDIDCRNNTETCVAVCTWAVSNCDYCANDMACMAKLDASCVRGCR